MFFPLLVFVREKAARRETKLLNVLLFVKSTLWKTLFGKEADKLEHANDDERTYYVIEKEPLVNRFISVSDNNLFYLEVIHNFVEVLNEYFPNVCEFDLFMPVIKK